MNVLSLEFLQKRSKNLQPHPFIVLHVWKYYMVTKLLLIQLLPIATLRAIQNCGDSNVPLRHFTNTTFFLGGIFPISLREKNDYILNEIAILWVSSMMFAIREINDNKDILPGIKIGYDIRDSRNSVLCVSEHALDFLLDNKRNSILIGVVGPAPSSLSVAVSTILIPDFVPQVSYASTSISLSKRSTYRNFLRTAPSDAYQAKAIIDLIEYFDWTYVSLFASDDEYGRFGYDEVRKVAKEKNICFSVDKLFASNLRDEEANAIIEDIKQNSHVVILWCDSFYAERIIQKSLEQGLQNITWIGTESWGNKILLISSPKQAHNIFVLQFKDYMIKNLDDEIQNVNVVSKINCGNPWYKNFLKKYSVNCPETIPSLSANLPKKKEDQVVGAVYALAYGLHNYLKCSAGKCLTHPDSIDYELLYKHVINTSFTVPTSSYSVKFDQNGEFLFPAYEYKTVHQGAFKTFGTWEFYIDKAIVVNINKTLINWGNNLIPKAICSLNCQPGTYRVNSTTSKCCWICVPCAQGSVSSAVNQYACTKCSASSIENFNQTQCIELAEIRLQVFSSEGLLIIIGSIIGVLGTSCVLILFMVHWNNPIIKSSNREMSCIQLFFIMLLFCISFLYFWKPTPTLCILQTLSFSFFFTTILAFVVVKTYRLLRVFNGRFTKASKFLENKFLVGFSFSLALLQTLADIIWYIYYPASVQIALNANRKEFYPVCANEVAIFWISFTIIFLLAIVSACLAFRARKLPENFNEAQHIAYAMFTICIVWITYLPLYLSVGPHDSKVAFLCVNIISCFSMLIILYGKKVRYIVCYRKLSNIEFFHNSSSETILHSFVENVAQEDGSTINVVRSVVMYNRYTRSDLYTDVGVSSN